MQQRERSMRDPARGAGGSYTSTLPIGQAVNYAAKGGERNGYRRWFICARALASQACSFRRQLPLRAAITR